MPQKTRPIQQAKQPSLAPGQTQQYKPYLTAWINKAVQQGGFTAEEASSALFALAQLQEPETENGPGNES